LLKALSPTVTVMNNGPRKGCGAETFATLKATSSIQGMYQMHRNLLADAAHNADRDFTANQEEKCTANWIKLSVDPTGATYVVSIPANGHQKTYQTRKH